MERFVKGDIVVIPFPFSDLSRNKKRPAFVIKNLPDNDILLCQITSKPNKDKYSVHLLKSDFKTGELPIESNIRINKIFTADKKIIIRKAGTVKEAYFKGIITQIIKLISE